MSIYQHLVDQDKEQAESASLLAHLIREREAIVNYLKSKCDPRTNPGGHLTAYEALVIAGERPEGEERK